MSGAASAKITLSVHDLAGNRLSEHDAGGAVLREYIWLDGRPLAVVEGGQTYWLHWDQIGRPVMAKARSSGRFQLASKGPFGYHDEVRRRVSRRADVFFELISIGEPNEISCHRRHGAVHGIERFDHACTACF